MKRIAATLFPLVLAAGLSAAGPLTETFLKAKEQFRLGDYKGALASLDRLEADSKAPGLEAQRAALAPALAFYRGAALAGLGRAPEAVAQFEIYLAHNPRAGIDPAIYSKSVMTAFEAAQKNVAAKSPEAAHQRTGEDTRMFDAYASFPAPPETGEDGSLGEDWSGGPVGVLLSKEERQRFETLLDPQTRSEFIEEFWRSRDPRPETPVNEFRREFEKRVAFADSRFEQDEKRGSMTDRGQVFLLMGPPTWVGRRPITAGDAYASGDAGLSQYNRHDMNAAVNSAGGSTGAKAAALDRVQSPSGKINEAANNWLEVWHFRRDLLPKGVPYQQVDVEFVTKRGYGENVLQRDPQVLTTIETARKNAASGGLQSASR
jgi:GWxTD domain-containing protein